MQMCPLQGDYDIKERRCMKRCRNGEIGDVREYKHNIKWTENNCPAGYSGSRTWKCNGISGEREEQPDEARCALTMQTIGGGIALLVCILWIWVLRNLPRNYRLPAVGRNALVMTISTYQKAFYKQGEDRVPFSDLPGVLIDTYQVCHALQSAGYSTAVHAGIRSARCVEGDDEAESDAFLPLFTRWCKTVPPGSDVILYIAAHGIKYEGSKWIVLGESNITDSGSLSQQCVEVNRLRMILATVDVRVTVWIIDCCATNLDLEDATYEDGELPPRSQTTRTIKGCVDVTNLNASRAALNVFIFNGAADSTSAMEDPISGGAFTNAFIKHMFCEDQTLEVLSQKVRSELTQGELQSLIPGLRVKATESFLSINAVPRTIKVGTYGDIISIDSSDNTTQVLFSGHDETQWVSARDCKKLKPDQEVQIAPSMNYLSHEYSGWSFSPSPPICCGLMPRHIENFLIMVIHKRSCCGDSSEDHFFDASSALKTDDVYTPYEGDKPETTARGSGAQMVKYTSGSKENDTSQDATKQFMVL